MSINATSGPILDREKPRAVPRNFRISESPKSIKSKDDQSSCQFRICYGESKMASLNNEVCKLELNGIPKKPKGHSRFKMTAVINIHGELNVRCYSLDNGRGDHDDVDVSSFLW